MRIHLFVDGVEQSNFVVGVGGSAINTVLTSVSIGTVVDVALDPNDGNDYFDLTQLLVSVRSCSYPSPALVVRVVYSTESIVMGPLSFGLPVLPESLAATIVLSDIDAAENVTAGLGDVASFSLGFGDGQWTELTSFSLVTDDSGEVTTLSLSTTEIDTPSVFGGGVLNSSFSATISGTEIASGQDFEYNYADSEQTLVVVPATLCEGDANGDGSVDPLDSGFVLARFGCPVGTGDPLCDAADQNGDGAVDPLDSGFVLARFGPCF